MYLFAQSEEVWHNWTCPAILMAVLIAVVRVLAGISGTHKCIKDAMNRLPPPAETPYAPPQPTAARGTGYPPTAGKPAGGTPPDTSGQSDR